MKIVLTGEDGLTYDLLTNKKSIETIKNDLELTEIIKVWFRPSFGRGAGTKYKPSEKGYSGFGESDALICAKDKNYYTVFVFLESKNGNIHKAIPALRELRYQFYLKLGLIDAMQNPKILQLGKSITKEHYCIDLSKEGFIANKLYQYYKEYKNYLTPESIHRNNGWKILKRSPSSDALNAIEDEFDKKSKIRFAFYAAGFTNEKENKIVRNDIFPDITGIPESTKKYFNIKEHLGIVFRTFKYDKKVVTKEIIV